VTTLVFLEHHDGAIQKGALGVLARAVALGGDVAGVVVGNGVADVAATAGAYGAGKVYVVDGPEFEAPLPQPRVDALEAVVAASGAENVLFGASVLAADVAAGLSARLDAGLNWDLTDLSLDGGQLVAKRPALGDTVVVDVGWTTTPRLALVRSGAFDGAIHPETAVVGLVHQREPHRGAAIVEQWDAGRLDRNPEAVHLAGGHRGGTPAHGVGREEVERAALVVVTPATAVGDPLLRLRAHS